MADTLGDINMDMDMTMDFSLPSTSTSFAPIAAAPLPATTNATPIPPQQPYSTTSDADQQIDPNAIGGGPLPAGFDLTAGTQSGNGVTGSTLTDFTKRRNWSQRVLEELRDFLHILTPEGRILYCSPSTKALTGYESVEIVGRFIGDFIHPDDSGLFIVEFNEAIASGNPLRFFYRFRRKDGSYGIFEAHGHPHLSSEVAAFGSLSGTAGAAIGGQGFCRGFFMMSRPYPTKNAGMLDSFLEHKIENERLTKRIAELRREEAEENEAAERHWQHRQDGGPESSITASETHRTDARTGTDSEIAYREMPPPAKPAISNTALTRQNLDEALAATKADSINDKMARYEGLSNHYDGIEMLTGLRYRDGERSKGISTGDTSPHLIRGDVGIAILADRDRSGKESKTNSSKKLKVADEYVCTDCGTLDSPEWRKGPNGPKTLCNACGLRWAKKEKKRQSQSAGATGPGGGMHAPPSLSMHASTGSG
ncbi:hypothetical protein NA57DRAFT_64892 [Rhizodiscina lignyota]|uniref:White collar-2 n=1 Tax=Rhizodiscina lignyota TaxID=1504668 RepID=A0A9P4IFZ2_9PEZI|nr:hypothetical protein NA57DRAFT_64892 [Rhizodiscina lignyota]